MTNLIKYSVLSEIIISKIKSSKKFDFTAKDLNERK